MTNRQRQHLLAYLGYYVGDISDNWTAECRVACRAFQEDFKGIKVDGYGGPETDKALLHAVAYGVVKATEGDSWWKEIEYFQKSEFACKCGQYHAPYCDGYPHEIQPLLVQICDRARKHFGRPAHVVSGLRDSRWNAIQGGVANSQHKYGEAADVYFHGVSADAALGWLQSQPEVRYAYRIDGCSNIHLDIPKAGR